MGCLLHYSPKFYNNLFLFVGYTTLGTYYVQCPYFSTTICNLQKGQFCELTLGMYINLSAILLYLISLVLITGNIILLANTPLEASSATLNVFFIFKICLCQVDVYVALESLCKIEKRKKYLDFLFLLEGGGVGQVSLKIDINLSRTYEKLYCKEEPYWFSGQRDP